MFRKSLMVVLCVVALLVGMSAFGGFGASAHAAALRPPSVVGGGGSGGGCGGQPGSVTACIYISPANGHLVAYYLRNSWPANCYQINIQILSDSTWYFSHAYPCSTYEGVTNVIPYPGATNQAKATMFYSDGSVETVRWSPVLNT